MAQKYPRIEREVRVRAVVAEDRDFTFWLATENVQTTRAGLRADLKLLHVQWSCGIEYDFTTADGRKLLTALAQAARDARRGVRSRRTVRAANLAGYKRPTSRCYGFRVSGVHGNYIVNLFRSGQHGGTFKPDEAATLLEAGRAALKGQR